MKFLMLWICICLPALAQAQAPDTTAAWTAVLKARSFAKQGKYDSCATYFKQAAEGFKAYALALPDTSLNWVDAHEHYLRFQLFRDWNVFKGGHIDSAFTQLTRSLSEVQALPGAPASLLADFYINLGAVSVELAKFDTSLAYYQKALDIYLSKSGEQVPKVALLYSNIGVAYRQKGEYDVALTWAQKALALKHEILAPNDPMLASSYNNVGDLYMTLGDYDRALHCFKTGLSIRLAYWGPRHPDNTQGYFNVGMIYMKKGEYDRAMDFVLKSLELSTSLLGAQHPNVGRCCILLGDLSYKRRDYPQAEAYFQRGLTVYGQSYSPDHPIFPEAYDGLGAIQHDLGAPDSALFYFRKALAVRLLQEQPNLRDLTIDYMNISTAFTRSGEMDSALHYVHKAIDGVNLRQDVAYPLAGKINHIIATMYAAQNQRDSALKYVENCLEVFIPNYRREHTYTSLKVSDAFVLESGLMTKIMVLEKRRARGDDKAALATVRFADRVIDSLRNVYTYENDKLQLGEDAAKIYGLGMDVALWNKQDQEAFYFAEKDKAAVLMQSLNESYALRFGGAPDSLVQRDKDLKLRLAHINKDIADKLLSCPGCDSARIRNLQAEHYDTEQQYDSLKNFLEAQYPQYFALKHAQHVTGVEELQKTFLKENPNTAILEYIMTDSVLFTFLVTKDAYKIHRLKLDTTEVKKVNTLQKDVRALTQALSSPRLPGWTIERYVEPAARLYEVLLKPFEKEIKEKTLVIIPDGELQKIPFEALLRERPLPEEKQWRDLLYLARFHDISYHYSATLFLDEWRKSASKGQGLVAFAPVFADTTTGQIASNADAIATPLLAMLSRGDTSGRAFLNDGSEVAPLPGTEREVKTIYDLFTQKKQPAQYYLSGNADEATVTTTDLRKYKYIHFATHGLTDEDHPDRSCLILAQTTDSTNDNLLTGSEMYGLNLDADLVVLSACQTGKGQLRAGEGVIGLTRGLLYAGSRNLVVSQWNVNDASTADLMTRFYTHLLTGQSNRAALRNAKLELLSGQYACPHYWAPFVLVGR